MSLHLEFEPHSWYMGFAIQDTATDWRRQPDGSMLNPSINPLRWHAYTDNGNTYFVDEVKAGTLAELKQEIRKYHLAQNNGYAERMLQRGTAITLNQHLRSK
jgi:hypothetical protein